MKKQQLKVTGGARESGFQKAQQIILLLEFQSEESLYQMCLEVLYLTYIPYSYLA